METIPADPLFLIQNLETLRVISDPLRLKIFQAVSRCNQAGALCSARQIADALGLPQVRLYYHIRQLEAVNLLVVGETRLVSGIVEKLYRVRAYRVVASNDLFVSREAQEAVLPLFSEMIDSVQADLQALLRQPESAAMEQRIALTRRSLRLPAGQVQAYAQRLENLLQEMDTEANAASDQDAGQYAVFCILYPESTSSKGISELDPA